MATASHARGTGRWLTGPAVVALVVALGGCQTVKSLQAQFIESPMEAIDGRMVDAAPEHRYEPLQQSIGTAMLDRFRFTDADGNEIGINVAEAVDEQRKLHADMKEQVGERGLSPLEFEERRLNLDNVVTVKGPGRQVLMDYLDGITDRLLAAWPHGETDPPIRVELVDSDDYQASHSDLNVIRLHVGVLVNAESEDEIAAIIAHELGHALLQHQYAKQRQALENKVMMVGASLAANYLADGNLPAGGSGLHGGSRQAVAVLLAEQGLRKLDSAILYPSWQRHLEDQCDMLAIDLLHDADYDWEALYTVLERLADAEAKRKAAKAEARQAAEQDVEDATNELGMAAGIAAFRQKMTADFASIGETLAADHAEASARLQSVKRYSQREYGDAPFPGPEPSTERLREAVWSGAGFQALSKRAHLKEVHDALEAGDFEAAALFSRKALASTTDTDPEVRYLFYQARKGQGDTVRAIRNLEIALDDPAPTQIVFDTLVEEYEQAGRHREARTAFLRRVETLPTPYEQWVPRLVTLHVKAGDPDAAARLVARCEGSQDALFKARCQQAYRRATGVGEASPPAAAAGQGWGRT